MVSVEAPAKLNLHLQVLESGPDGFHRIASVFQAISLADRLVLRSLKATRGVELQGSFDCPPHVNTITRAARAWLEAADIDAGVEITVDKRVPAGAGLGGGSSDAAATLKGLQALFGIRLGEATMSRIARSIGSDVPFFLGSARAFVTGRGEILEPLDDGFPFHAVVVDPGFAIRTPDAYRALDASRFDPRAPVTVEPAADHVKEAFRGNPRDWPFRNDFLEALAPAYPELEPLVGRLRSTGAAFSGLSGSGSACFALYEDGAEADRIAAGLSRDGLSAFSCAALARLPEPGYNSALDSAVG
ncbi:MAG: 4-(cytidine 5'-diphospho)-2-C-methyl-D-erythritol kinase [Spirochaetales bacterium]|nr:4-(cytidine 5'-diphospho)-2-C-methyl-D-erythritol kinase [Spirochaetales bacterium]